MKNLVLFSILSVALTAVHAQVGVGTTSPNSMLDVRGSLSIGYRSFTKHQLKRFNSYAAAKAVGSATFDVTIIQ